MDNVRASLVQIAQAILDEKIHVVLGCREIDRLRSESSDRESPIFNPFRVVSSETDSFPFGDVRRHWNDDVLAQRDLELKAYVCEIHESIKQACHAIIDTYGSGR